MKKNKADSNELNEQCGLFDEINLNKFDYIQYKKDMDILKELTERIIKNDPLRSNIKNVEKFNDKEKLINELSKYHNIGNELINNINFGEDGKPVVMNREYHEKIFEQKVNEKKKETSFQKEIDEMLNFNVNKINTNVVDDDIVKMINKKCKEKDVVFKPSILQELEKLNMYRVFAIDDDKFSCAYLDFELEESDSMNNKNKITEDDLCGFKSLDSNTPTINCKLFSAMGRLKENYIDVIDKNIDISIKDFICSHTVHPIL